MIRLDMQFIRDAGPDVQARLWPRFTSEHPWFEIPESLKVARTFMRDELDAIYLDHMYNFVNLCESPDVHLFNKELPLFYLRDFLVGRRWNMFSQHKSIFEAINHWHKFRVWVSHDSFDLDLGFQAQYLSDIHPNIFE